MEPEIDIIQKLVDKVVNLEKRISTLESNEYPTVRIKGTAGDFATGYSGQIVINTVDNNIKMYGDSGWRTLVSY